MVDNTCMQTMQSAINKLTEQSDGFHEQLATITQALTSLQVQITQNTNPPHRHSVSSFAAPRQLRVEFPSLVVKTSYNGFIVLNVFFTFMKSLKIKRWTLLQ